MATSDTDPTLYEEAPSSRLATVFRFAGWMLLAPMVACLVLSGLAYVQINNYFTTHENRIYMGINALDIDLSSLTQGEALAALATPAGQFGNATVELVDPRTGAIQALSWSQLGVSLDTEAMVDQAIRFGRNRPADDQAIFWTWYRGQTLPPIWQIDEGAIDLVVRELAGAIDQTVQHEAVSFADGDLSTSMAQTGYVLDQEKLQADLLQAAQAHLDRWQGVVQIELSIAVETPQFASVGIAQEQLSTLLSGPLDFYISKPISTADLQLVQISAEQIESWVTLDESGAEAQMILDTSAIRRWLINIAPSYLHSAENARFYFDDLTQALVLIEPHVNGRSLNIEATYQQILAKINSSDRRIELIMNEIVPEIHSDVKAADLGIIELLSTETTYFYDSSPERKHNIQLGATKFHGLILEPGEEFSFNHHLGEISENAGFKDGLVIIGGRTQSGIGGGICQVSTTLFQTVFWSGLAIGARNQHGYRVPYYEMAPGNGTKPLGMDAAIYSPIVDFTFTNNSTHHLLMETYYRADNESLTFKFYSTSLGRTIERDIWVSNERSAEIRNKYRFNPELEEGEIRQVEWEADGADVLVHRIVYNQWGEQRDEDYFESEYQPWSNVYEYGPNTVLPSPSPTPEPETPTPDASLEAPAEATPTSSPSP